MQMQGADFARLLIRATKCPGAAAGRTPRSSHPAVSAFPGRGAGSACTSSFSRLARRSLALRPAHSRGHQFVTRYPKASDISSPPCLLRLLPAGAHRRVGLAPTGKRRLVTAHTLCSHWRARASAELGGGSSNSGMLTVKTFLRYEGRTRERLNLKAEILGMRGVIHHLDLTVKDPEQVFGFYNAVLSARDIVSRERASVALIGTCNRHLVCIRSGL